MTATTTRSAVAPCGHAYEAHSDEMAGRFCSGCNDWCPGCTSGDPVMATAKYHVCPTCEGEGTIVNRAVSVWTESDRAEDPEGFQDMLQGRYDVTCDQCGGKRVVTQQEDAEYAERRRDYFTRLQEQGIYPGSRDYF